jgi:hypothetical protein
MSEAVTTWKQKWGRVQLLRRRNPSISIAMPFGSSIEGPGNLGTKAWIVVTVFSKLGNAVLRIEAGLLHLLGERATMFHMGRSPKSASVIVVVDGGSSLLRPWSACRISGGALCCASKCAAGL